MSAAYPFVPSASTMLWQSLLFPDTRQMVALLCKKKVSLNTQREKMQNYARKCTPLSKWRTEIKTKTKTLKHVRRYKSNPRFHIQHKRMNKFRPFGVVDPPRKIWGKWAQFLHECASTIPEHSVGRDPKKHWALLSTPGSGVCLCVSVRVSNYALWPYMHSSKHSGRLFHTNWHRRLHQTSIFMHAHTLQTLMLPFFFPFPSSHVHATKMAHRCEHRRHTQAFSFPHSCVLISNRARWGRTNTLTRKD